jgi:4-hydroxy-tetrahydrodipicolinate reductase
MGERVRVGVCGATGRLGAATCRAIASDESVELVAAVSRRGGSVPGVSTPVATDADAFVAAGCDVVVDFTNAAAAREHLPALLRHGIHAVVGTSGLGDDDLADLAAASAAGGGNVVVAANFAISAVVMLRLCELAAPYFDTAEIIELHHNRKIDAPSGTAIATAQRIAAASDEWAADPTESETIAAARGASGPGGIRIHSVRMRGMVAHQEVVFGAAGQTLTLRQDSYDLEGFMPGILLACKRVGELPGLTVGLEAVLGL